MMTIAAKSADTASTGLRGDFTACECRRPQWRFLGEMFHGARERHISSYYFHPPSGGPRTALTIYGRCDVHPHHQ